MSVPLYAALAIPSFVVQAHIDSHPELYRKAFALVNQVGQRSVVIDISPAAARQGLYPGANQWRAKRRYPDVEFRELESTCAADLWAKITTLAQDQSPRCMLLRQGLLVIDLTGMQRLFKGGERAWALDFSESLRQFQSLSYSLVLAPQMGSALLLARYRASLGAQFFPDKVSFGMGVMEELAPVPIQLVMGLKRETRRKLKHYQLSTLGQVQSLPLRFLREHFDQEGELLWLVAQGRSFGKASQGVTLESQSPKEQKSRVEKLREFGQDVQEHQILQTHLHDVLDELAFELRFQQRWTKQVVVELIYSDQKTHKETFKLGRATNKFLEMMEVIRPRWAGLFRRRVSVRSIQVVAMRCVASGGQEDLFDQVDINPMMAIQEALDRIRSKHGFAKIGNPPIS